jgi:aminocarboxymuconate-semialdehyde decarboxylase
MRSSPRELAMRLCYDTVLHSVEMIKVLIDLVGPHQVLLGSDYPFEMGEPDPVSTLDKVAGLDDQDRELILRGNLERLTLGPALTNP